MSIVIETLESIFVPLFIEHCNKYNIDLNLLKTTNLIIKGKFSNYQFNGFVILGKKLDQMANKNEFIGEFLKFLENRNIIDVCEYQYVKNFININIKKIFISTHFSYSLHDLKKNNNQTKNVIIDYSSPNIAKELHVGHLRSTIIGDCLANLYEHYSYNVFRINHIGDWGGQFGMVIAYAKKFDIEIKSVTISQLMEMYQNAKQLICLDDEFKMQTKNYVLLLQNNDSECIQMWKLICQISKDDYLKIYEMLNIKEINEIGESFYNKYAEHVIQILKNQNLLIESNGAHIVETKNHPLIIIKSDGGYTYDTTDIIAIWYRTQIMFAHEIVYLTDIGQRTHFEGVFEIADKAGWTTHTKCFHLGFGLIMKNGAKISSRIKTTAVAIEPDESIKLKDLLNDSIESTKEEWIKKESYLNSKKKYISARNNNGYIDMAINSIKYYDLLHSYQTSYNFNKVEMIKMEGNTATYVMYIYARINNVIGNNIINPDTIFDPILNIEKELGLKILELDDVINHSFQTKQMNVLIDYIYELASKFSTMWSSKDGHIIGSVYEQSRLLLCLKLKKTFEFVFDILGMKLLDCI